MKSKPNKGTKLSPVRTVNRDELSDELDIRADSIARHHTRANPPPFSKDGRVYLYNVAEYRAWMDSEGLTGERGGDRGPTSPDIEEARLRKESALADKYELQVAREKRELIPANEVRQWIGEHIGRAKNKLIGMAASISPRLEGLNSSERQQEIERYIELVIRDIRDATTSVA